MRIYKTTDRIKLEIGEGLIVTISPLNRAQKQEIQSLLMNTTRMVEGASLAVKYAVKDIQGLEDENGEPYRLEFEGGALTEKCIDDLLNLEVSSQLQTVCVNLLNGVSKDLPQGVSFVEKK